MVTLAAESSIKLVVKTPNQSIKDIEVNCLLDWTVEKLKGHLSLVYPTKPDRSSQKIIYSGKLLNDDIILKDILQESEGSHQTVHLLCTSSSSSDVSTSQMTTSASNLPTSSSPEVSSAPSTSTMTQGSTEPDGLRHRNHPFTQHPFHNFHHFTHSPFTQANVSTHVAGHYMFPQGHQMFPQGHQMFPQGQHMFQQSHQMFPPSHPHMYPNAQYFGVHNIHYAAQHMAHMHWMHHVAMQRNMQGSPVAHPNIPPPQEDVPDPVPQENQPEVVPPAPPARERQENPAQNQNMVMNANAGGGMMQGEDDEENGQRDWLDYVYMAVRISMLMSIFWFYSSAERLIIMGLVVFIVWLVQSGVFNLNRAPINRRQEPQVNQANNAAERQEQGEEQGTEEGEVTEQDSESESESQTEDETDNTNNNNNETHPGYFFVWYNFFVTFFTSLVPQAPGAIAQP